MITLPTGFDTSLISKIGELFSDLSPFIVIAVTFGFANYMVHKILSLLPRDKDGKVTGHYPWMFP